MNNARPMSEWHHADSLRLSANKIVVWLVLATLLAGCWAPAIKPTSSDLHNLHSILIVPLESPPLEVLPDPLAQREPAYSHYQNMALDFPAQTLVYQTPSGITVAGKVSQESLTEGDLKQSDIAGDQQPDWTPAKTAALRLRKLLADENYQGVVSEGFSRLAMADNQRGPGLQQWHDAIQTWYGLEHSATDYRPQGQFDAVLELGIGGYRIFEDQVSLQVLLKLVDPASRRVLARARDQSFTVDGAALASLIHDGQQFKQLVADMSVPLLRQALADIGLQGPVRSED